MFVPALLHLLVVRRANIFMVTIPKNAKVAGKTIRELAGSEEFPSQCVVIAVYSEDRGQFSIPRGEQVITEGDELFLISSADNIKAVVGFVTAEKEASGVAEVQQPAEAVSTGQQASDVS